MKGTDLAPLLSPLFWSADLQHRYRRSVAASLERTASELSTIADNIGRYRERVAGLAEPFIGTERDDLVIAIHEAERQLRSAERSLQRALRQVD